MPVVRFGSHSAGWMLKVAAISTLAFSAAEFAAGSYAGSLALISDAAHNLSGALALLVMLFAFYIQGRPPSSSQTYGYHRAAVLAAFVAALGLLAAAAVLFYKGYRGLTEPLTPNTAVMIAAGAGGLVLNVLLSAALRRASWVGARPHTVLVHIAGDAVAAFGVLAAALVIHFTGRYAALDPFLAILIAGLIVWSAWDIVTESLDVLLEGMPRGMSLDQVAGAIREVAGVEDVHDLHIWSLSAQTHALSCHLRVANVELAESEAILAEVNTVLGRDFSIRHTTIQVECAACEAVEGCRIT